jgi:pimeloyl-ACP methyl ester carboxylesterase
MNTTMKTQSFSSTIKQGILSLMLLSLMITTTLAQRTSAALARSEYIEAEGNVRLHVTDHGQGKAIVLIHGWPLSDAMYEYQYHALVQNGFRVIGITLRGFGKSDKPYGQYNYDVYADDIKVVLDKLKIEQATLGGFSMGGAISIHYVARHNSAHVSKLALFGAAAPVWTQREDYPYGFTKEAVDGLIQLSTTDRPQLLENFGKIFGASGTSVPKGLGSWLGTISLEAAPLATTQSLIALRDTDLRSELSKIKIPTAIFHGKKDIICSFDLAQQMNAGIKGSFIIPFENSGHGLFIEEREKFNAELIKFAK